MITLKDIIEKGIQHDVFSAIYFAVQERNKMGSDFDAINGLILRYISDETGLSSMEEAKRVKILKAIDYIETWDEMYRALKVLVPYCNNYEV